MNWIFLEIRLFYGGEYNAVQFSHTLLVLVGRLIEHKAPELEKVVKRKDGNLIFEGLGYEKRRENGFWSKLAYELGNFMPGFHNFF